jgi:hypothetical protein
MEDGFIEGTYLIWVTERQPVRRRLRSMVGGVTTSRIGKGLWPSDLAASRCATCGYGVFHE